MLSWLQWWPYFIMEQHFQFNQWRLFCKTVSENYPDCIWSRNEDWDPTLSSFLLQMRLELSYDTVLQKNLLWLNWKCCSIKKYDPHWKTNQILCLPYLVVFLPDMKNCGAIQWLTWKLVEMQEKCRCQHTSEHQSLLWHLDQLPSQLLNFPKVLHNWKEYKQVRQTHPTNHVFEQIVKLNDFPNHFLVHRRDIKYTVTICSQKYFIKWICRAVNDHTKLVLVNQRSDSSSETSIILSNFSFRSIGDDNRRASKGEESITEYNSFSTVKWRDKIKLNACQSLQSILDDCAFDFRRLSFKLYQSCWWLYSANRSFPHPSLQWRPNSFDRCLFWQSCFSAAWFQPSEETRDLALKRNENEAQSTPLYQGLYSTRGPVTWYYEASSQLLRKSPR